MPERTAQSGNARSSTGALSPKVTRTQAGTAALAPSEQRLALLQQTLGNQGVLRRMEAGLRINDVNDPAEREADHLADQVMSTPQLRKATPAAISVQGSSGPIQRKCAACEEENETPYLQRKESSPSPASFTGSAPATVIQTLNSAGHPLDPATRSFMEGRFGHDFGNVRVHADATAAESAEAVNARAYTFGTDIVFGQGEYSPQESAGARLLAHELTHVIQQADVAARGKSRSTAAGAAKSTTPTQPAIQRQPRQQPNLGLPDLASFTAADPEAASLLRAVLTGATRRGIPTGKSLPGGPLPGGGSIKFVFDIDPAVSAFGTTTVTKVSGLGTSAGEIVISMVFNSSNPQMQTWFHEFQHALILVSKELFKNATTGSAPGSPGSPAAIAAMKSSRTSGKYWADLAKASLLPQGVAAATDYRKLLGAATSANSNVKGFTDAEVIEHAINERRASLEEQAFVVANRRGTPSAAGLPGIIAGALILPLRRQLNPVEQGTFDATVTRLGLRADLEASLVRLFAAI